MQNQKEFDANQVSNKDCRDAMADDCSDLRIGTRSYQKFTQGSPHSWGTIKESLGGTGKITLEPLGSSPNGFGSANIHQERRNAAEFTGMVNSEGHGKVEPRDSQYSEDDSQKTLIEIKDLGNNQCSSVTKFQSVTQEQPKRNKLGQCPSVMMEEHMDQVIAEDSASNAGSYRSYKSNRSNGSDRSNMTAMSSKSQRAAKTAGLKAKMKRMNEKYQLEEQVQRQAEEAQRQAEEAQRQARENALNLRKRMEMFDLQTELEVMEAEEEAFEKAEAQMLHSQESPRKEKICEPVRIVTTEPTHRDVTAHESRETTVTMQVDDRYLRVDEEISLETKTLRGDEVANVPRLVPELLATERFTPIVINKQEPKRLDVETASQAASNTGSISAQDMRQLIGVLQAPKVTLMTFDGEPLRYHQFIRTFEENVDNVMQDNAARLTRLAQYCTGKAKKVVDSCLLMDPDEGYPEARRLLRERFGRKIVIASLWVQKLTEEKQQSLRDYADDLRACQKALQALGSLNELNTQGNLRKLTKKLPLYLQQRWLGSVVKIEDKEDRMVTLQDLVEFMEQAAREADHPTFGQLNRKDKPDQRQPEKKSSSPGKSYVFNVAPASPEKKAAYECIGCGNNHKLDDCKDFAGKTLEERIQVVMRRGLCLSCLKTGHRRQDCKSDNKCKEEGCGRRHHSLLHGFKLPQRQKEGRNSPNVNREQKDLKPSKDATEDSSDLESQGTCAHAVGRQKTKMVLPIVAVKVTSPGSKRTVDTYALLDLGSTHTFCTQSLLDELGVKGHEEKVTFSSFSEENTTWKSKVAALEVKGRDCDEKISLPYVYSRKRLSVGTGNLATQKQLERWPHLQNYCVPETELRKVSLLIGQDCPRASRPLETVGEDLDEPYAMRTRLGWTVTGPITAIQSSGREKNYPQETPESYVGHVHLSFIGTNDSYKTDNLKDSSQPQLELTTQAKVASTARYSQVKPGIRRKATRCPQRKLPADLTNLREGNMQSIRTKQRCPQRKFPGGLTNLQGINAQGIRARQRGRHRTHPVVKRQKESQPSQPVADSGTSSWANQLRQNTRLSQIRRMPDPQTSTRRNWTKDVHQEEEQGQTTEERPKGNELIRPRAKACLLDEKRQ